MNKLALDVLRYKDVERLPAVHFGYWPELLAEWTRQGHITEEFTKNYRTGCESEWELDKMLGWDHNFCYSFSGNLWFNPPFEHKVIETLPDGMMRVQNSDGVIERIKPGAEGIPGEDDYLLKDRESYEKFYKDKIQYSPDRVDETFFRSFNDKYRDSKIPLGLHVGSLLGTIRNFLTLVGMSYLMYDDFVLFQEIMDTFADLQYRVTEQTLKTGAKFDIGHYWEDICFKNGPLISPVMFEKLCMKHYVKRNKLLNSYDIDLIYLDCDGVVDSLLPVWIESGINILFPLEIGTWGDQFEKARKKYGKQFLGVGGFDKKTLRLEKSDVDKELERIKPLVAMGGYIPCPDHCLMPGTKWELVQYYTDKIKSIKI